MNQEQIKEATLRLAEQLKGLYKDKLKAVFLYGSVAKGTDLEDSDDDILVLVDATQEELRKYSDALSDISTDFAMEFQEKGCCFMRPSRWYPEGSSELFDK